MPQQPEPQLPADLAEALLPPLRRALEHPIRRRILRTLDGEDEGRTLEEMTTALPGASLSTVNYHLRTLQTCQAVSIAWAGSSSGPDRYASDIDGNPAIGEILSRMREHDEAEGFAS